MSVNVLYDGVLLAEAADPRKMAPGVFLSMAGPMPVGTRLALVAGEARRDVQVARVLEAGEETGVVVVGARGERLSVERLFSTEPSALAEAMGAMEGAPQQEMFGVTEPMTESVIEFEAETDDERPTLQMPAVTAEEVAAAETAAAGANGAPKVAPDDGAGDNKKGKRRRGRKRA